MRQVLISGPLFQGGEIGHACFCFPLMIFLAGCGRELLWVQSFNCEGCCEGILRF